MTRYNHLTSIAFTVVSETPDGSDWTPKLLRDALMRRVRDLDSAGEWLDAAAPPSDTYEEEG